jgi:ABC-type transport system involved in multi-copper enzyme maturation permease subunit
MKVLYLIILFIICCSSLIIKPSKIPVKYKYSRISIDTYNDNYNDYNQLKLQKPLIIKNDNNNDNIQKFINNPSNFSFILLIILVYIHIFLHI